MSKVIMDITGIHWIIWKVNYCTLLPILHSWKLALRWHKNYWRKSHEFLKVLEEGRKTTIIMQHVAVARFFSSLRAGLIKCKSFRRAPSCMEPCKRHLWWPLIFLSHELFNELLAYVDKIGHKYTNLNARCFSNP